MNILLGLRRVLGAVVTLLIALALVFVLTSVTGDPVRFALGELATQEQVDAMRTNLGLDQPLPVQFAQYVVGLFQGDFGDSLRYGRPNSEIIAARIAASLQLTLSATAIAAVLGVSMGVGAARRPDAIIGRSERWLSSLAQSVPAYWLGMLLILVFAIQLGWLPAGQRAVPTAVILPAVTLALFPAARISRLTRASIERLMEEPFVVALRARGLSERRVVYGHVLRNAALPILTLVSLQLGTLLAGAVTVEFVFAWPGLGQLLVQAILQRDFPLVQAVVGLGAIVFVLINAFTDVLYGVIDPRIKEYVESEPAR